MYIPFPSFTTSPTNSCPGITGGSTYRALFSSPTENIYIYIYIYVWYYNITRKIKFEEKGGKCKMIDASRGGATMTQPCRPTLN